MTLFGSKNKVSIQCQRIYGTVASFQMQNRDTNATDFANDGTTARQDYATTQQTAGGNLHNTNTAGTGGPGVTNHPHHPTSATGNQFGNQTAATAAGTGGPGHHVSHNAS